MALFRLAAICATLIVGVMATDSESETASISSLPDNVLYELTLRCAMNSLDDVFSLSATCRDVRRSLSSLIQLQLLVRGLSNDGLQDGLWLDACEFNPDDIHIPPLPYRFPKKLVKLINALVRQLPGYRDYQPSEFVKRIRAKYPPELARVFPHCHWIAEGIVQKGERFLRHRNIVLYLRAIGICFASEDLPCGESSASERQLPSPVAPFPRGPAWLIVSFADRGRYDLVLKLLRIYEYTKEVRDLLMPALVSIMPSIPVDIFRQLLPMTSFRRVINDDYESKNFLEWAVEHYRFDLAEMLITESTIKPALTFSRASDILNGVHLDARRLVDVVRLRDHDHFECCFDRQIARVVGILVDRVREGDAIDFFQAILQEPFIATEIIPRRTWDNRTIMGTAISQGKFDLMAVLLTSTVANFQTADNEGRSDISRLPRASIPEFVAHLPDPKRESLCRFQLRHLVAVLLVVIDDLASVEAVCDVLPELVDVEYCGETIMDRALIRAQADVVQYLLGVPSRRIPPRAPSRHLIG